MSHTAESAIQAVDAKEEHLQEAAQEILAQRVNAAQIVLQDAKDDLEFATNDFNYWEAKYSPQYDRKVVIFENPERTRKIEVPVTQ